MKRFSSVILGSVAVFAGLAASTNEALRKPSQAVPIATFASHAVTYKPSADFTLIIQQYCVVCHNDVALTGNLSLQSFDVAEAAQHAETAERVIRKLTAGMMPPPGLPRPGGDTLIALRNELQTLVDDAAAANPNPGRRTFQRLNRVEYESSIRDLLGLEINSGDFLPLDTKSANFDNIADVQMPSATAMEGYLRAAGQISRIAVGDPDVGPSSASYKVPRTASQKDRVDGAPFGTRGGVAATHNFPADGKYVFQLMLHSAPEGELFGRNSSNEQIEVSIDGERVAVLSIDPWMSESDSMGMTMLTDSIFVRAGARNVAAAFIKLFEGPEDDLITPIEHTLADTQIGLGYGVTTLPHLRDLSIVGPFTVSGVSETPSRRRIFTCRPTSPSEEQPCAREIVARLAAQAYRRPLTNHDIEGLMSFYETGASERGFEAGIQIALQTVLASPHFMFRIEEGPSNAGPGEIYSINDIDMASRLSFFLWGAPPDDQLLEAARRNRLSSTRYLEAEVRRMLADPRSDALATRFAAQWLRLQDLDKVHPDALAYPYYDQTLAQAMHRETEMLFSHLIREDRSVLELLTADYTFINQRLAQHYGIPGVVGTGFQRVNYPDETRRGILGHGSILTLTSHGDRTSPVLRGKWVMEVLLGTPPPPPPPGVPDLAATKGAQEGRMLTTRERMEMHRSNAVCESCHRFMDPIGLALDNFDVTGQWRIKENGMPLDTRGELYDGTPLSTPDDLRGALISLTESVIRNFTANLLAYGLGRRVEYYDMPTVRQIVRDAADEDNRMSAFIMGVVNSPAFRTAKTEETLAVTSEMP